MAERKAVPAKAPTDKTSQNNRSNGQVFFMRAADMSWQLALVVLVPIVGGYELDKHFNLSPTLTIVGFILAMIGSSLVLWRQLQRVAPKITQADIDAAKKLRDKEDDD